MRDSSDPKKISIRDNTADAGHPEEKQLWHAPVLQLLDVSLLTATHVNRHRAGLDGGVSPFNRS
jgi:hypothetical protein